MPPNISTRPTAINLDYYPGQTVTLVFTFPAGYLATRVMRSFLGGRSAPGVELTCTKAGDKLTVTASAASTAVFDWPVEWELAIFDNPGFTTIFVGTWTPGTEGQAVPVSRSFAVTTPDDIAVTVQQATNVPGPAGPTGATGATGPQGPQGPQGPAGTSGIRVEDEGVSTVAAATALNFAGAGVTVTDAGANEATVTIPGGAVPGAWTAYAPTLTQSAAVAHTVNRAKWVQIGKTVHVSVFLTVTGTGTANALVTVSLPIAALFGGMTVGVGRIYDDSAGTVYRALVVGEGTGAVRWEGGNTTAGGGLGPAGQPFTAALAVNDVIDFSATYEVA